MADIQNIKVAVNVDISSAIAKLTDLQDELSDLAADIEKVDARGAEGIDIRTDVDSIDDDLTKLAAKIKAFESSTDIDVATNTDNLTGPGFQTLGSPTAADPGDLAAGMGMLFGDDRRSSRRGRMMRRMTENMSESLDSAIDRLKNFNLRMSDIHNAMAALIPLLIVFIGAIPAAVTAILTLAAAALSAAAAFAAIGAFGAMGMATQGGNFDMERLTSMMEDIRDTFIETFAPLAERLQPLFEDGLDGLEKFFQAVADQGDALVALSDEARAFGGWLIEFVPEMLRTLAGLAEAFDSVFGQLGSYLSNNFRNVIRGLIQDTYDALPAISALINMLLQALPGLIQVSIGFARVATAVLWVIKQVGRLASLFGVISGEHMGMFLASLLSIASALAITSALVGLLSDTIIAKGISSLASYAASALFGASSFTALSYAEMAATAALIAFLTVASLGVLAGLAAVAAAAASSFLTQSDAIDQATASLKDFNRVSGRTDGSSFNPYGGGNAPRSGAGRPGSSVGGGASITIERTGDRESDKSTESYAYWRQGRTSGGNI